MHTYLETGERLKCRKCATEAGTWCITTTEELKVGCSKCDVVITGDHAEAMCIEQRCYFEACRYRDQVEQAGSSSGIPIPESVEKFREQLGPGDREAYPLFGNPPEDPQWPFHY